MWVVETPLPEQILMTVPRGLAEGTRNTSERSEASVGYKDMPQNKSKRSSRAGRSRAVRRPRTAVIPAQPRELHLDFRIQNVQTLTEAGAGIGADYAFRLNSLYDSNATGVGSQPVGYDQWSELFLRSVVYRGRFQLEFVNVSTGGALEVGYYLKSGTAPAISGSTNWASQYGAKSRMLVTTGRNAASFNLSYDVARWLGVTRSKILNEEDYSESAAGPAVSGNNQLLLYIWIRGFGTTGSATIRLRQNMTAKMMEANTLSLS